MPLTIISYPNFTQSKSSDASYAIGQFQASRGQWFRVTLAFNAMPVHNGLGYANGNHYSASVAQPDGTTALVGTGVLFGSQSYYPGAIHGVCQASADGTCQLNFATWPADDLSGACDYANFTALVETYPRNPDQTDPVTVLPLADFSVSAANNGAPAPIGWFTAVPGRQYKVTAVFDGVIMAGPANLSYNLASKTLTGFPGPMSFSAGEQLTAAKCTVTAVVTAQAATCDLSLATTAGNGSVGLQNFVAFVEPFNPPTGP